MQERKMAPRSETAAALVREGARILHRSGIDEADNDAFLLFSHVSGYDRSAYLLHAPDPVGEEAACAYRKLIDARAQRIPLQHLTGTQAFAGIELHVTGDVLIPRQDTECLFEEARQFLSGLMQVRSGNAQLGRDPLRVLDLCTGSGCLALALKAQFPSVRFDACDFSERALALAADNAKRLSLEVFFAQGDLFGPYIPGQDRFDLIISNPPYIPTNDISALQPEVRDHDPHLALDGGTDGLHFYRRIAKDAAAYMKEGAALMLEIGSDQREDVSSLLVKQGFQIRSFLRDLAGLDRGITAFR